MHARRLVAILVAGALGSWHSFAQGPSANDPSWVASAVKALDLEVQKQRQGFIVYEDLDSGYNHGTFSGVFGTDSAARSKITIDAGCVPAGNPPTGCSSDSNLLDKEHGTVIRFTFQALTGNQFVGVSCVEPEGRFTGQTGAPYDLRGITQLSFDAMSPDAGNGMRVQFGFGGSTAAFRTLSSRWERITIDLNSQTAYPDLQNTDILFTIVTNAANAPNGGTVLVDNIRFDPPPANVVRTLGFPAGYHTYGVLPAKGDQAGPIPIPPDQLFRNQSPVDVVAWLASLFTVMTGSYDSSAKMLHDSFVYDAANPNLSLNPTLAQNGTAFLMSCFSSGDLGLKNPVAGATSSDAQAGSARPCGFSVGTNYRVVLDGATGGQNATAILALLRGYATYKDDRYLSTARSLGEWIAAKLTDSSTPGFGGYYYGYQYVPVSATKEFLKSKTTVDNALIFAAFTALAAMETVAGRNDAGTWSSRADHAAQFVQAMYRPDGRFYTGTVPDSVDTDLSAGIRADGPRRGSEVGNSYDVIGNYSVVPLAVLASNDLRSRFDLVAIMKNLLTHEITVPVGGRSYFGFFSAERLTGPNGIDWVLTGEATVALRIVGAETSNSEIQAAAQTYFDQYAIVEQFLASGSIIPGATLSDENTRPYAQCLVSPFGCQPARPSLGATVLAVATVRQINPFALPAAAPPPTPRPVISRVANAASFVSGPVSPGEVVTIGGTNIGPAALVGSSLAADGKLSTTCGGSVQVIAGGFAAPMIYCWATQVSAVLPYEIATVLNPAIQVTYRGQTSNSLPLTLATTAPGVFAANGSGSGAGAILNQDTSLNSSTNPAEKGTIVVLYLTGEGQTNPPGETGKINNVLRIEDLPVPQQPVSVMIDGQPATFSFAGAAPSFVSGLMQINVLIPLTARSGNLPVVVTFGGNSSQNGVTVSVR